ncbi:MAG TPA: antibiotic biosynthesis monooxygenase, partial [Blastococcus sp.]
MYARSTTVRGKPQAMDEGIAYVRDQLMPAVRQMDGCIGLSMLADRDSGRCIITTSWADADAMRASADGVMPMRQRATEIMGGPAEVQEWEIAVMHRMHNAHHGACARVIWNDGDPADADADRVIDSFRIGVLPQLEDLPGCCSVSVMLDRGSGRAVVTTTYDSPQDMTQA